MDAVERMEQTMGKILIGDSEVDVSTGFAEGDVGVDSLPLGVHEPTSTASLVTRVGTPIAEMERRLILATLEHCDGDKKRAADVLKISLKTLYNRLNEYKP